MSIPFSGTFRRSGGVVSAIGKQLKQINLKSVDRITFTFDPFKENVRSIRDFLFHLSAPKIQLTNPKCVLKTEIVCNRQPSEIKFKLSQQAQEQLKVKEIKFLTDNLTPLELLQLYNKHITVLAPKEEPVTILQTKSEKKSAVGARRQPKKK
uniref:Large ribosomal subunit protein mL53 n=1 Tax=Tabanus bromius TaxID=304241 RepID=A0A0K8TSA9_TABBR